MQRFNSIINIKVDTCIDCGRVRKIYSLKRCDYCYKVYSNKARQDKFRESNPEKILKQQTQWSWYENKIQQLKYRCENCGDRIIHKDKKYDHWSICHILPKSIFKSIATHDFNWWEGCNSCHQQYDNMYERGEWEVIEAMLIFNEIKNRFNQFKNLIAQNEKRRIPKVFLNEE